MICYKRVLQISRHKYDDADKFPNTIDGIVFLEPPGLCKGSVIIFLDGSKPETTRYCGVYLCKNVGLSSDLDDLYMYTSERIGVINVENVDFNDSLWYVDEFNKLNKELKDAFNQKTFWYRLFHKQKIVPKLFCDRNNVREL